MKDYNVPKIYENPLLINSTVSDATVSLINYAGIRGLKILDATKSPYEINQGDSGDVPIEKQISKLGTVVYSNVILNKTFEWNDFRIDDCLISVTQDKKLVITDIQGKDNEVIEYIGLSNYQIQIIGRLNGSYNTNPKEETAILKKILSAGQTLAITSWWLQNLDISDIVVTGFNFAQTEGEYSTQYFTINAISDVITEALITQQ
jgi:hypothetical protein